MSGQEEILGLFRAAIAQDLALLASLHDRELDAAGLERLHAGGFPDSLGLRLVSAQGRQALAYLRQVLAELPSPLPDKQRDELAADYAAIYLTHALAASPCESVWLDDENLAMQAPMFETRAWYRRHGLGTADWRQRPDDHLCLQLQFLAHLAGDSEPASLAEACAFMDEHLLRWLPRFAAKVFQRCATPFHAALALLTAAYCEELRDLLADLLDLPRAEPAASAAPVREAPLHYMPGLAPSW